MACQHLLESQLLVGAFIRMIHRRVLDVHLIWVDSNNRAWICSQSALTECGTGTLTIFLMILVNLGHKLAVQDCFIVALRQIADAAKERAGEVRQWMESEIVDDFKGPICSIRGQYHQCQRLRIFPQLLHVGCNLCQAPRVLSHCDHVRQVRGCW
jgi:hypothetical protein